MNGGGKKRLNPSVSISQVSLPYLYIETEKYKKKISEAYHKVNEAKTWVKFIHGRCY